MKIVLTGGPGAGKTAMLELLAQEFATEVRPVPEAASLLFHAGFPRGGGPAHQRAQQRAIYRVQQELECIGGLEANGRALLCDRGSMDALAYWPADPDSFFAELGTSREKELRRYDWVIHLALVANSPKTWLRIENDFEANAIDERLRRVWQAHPRQIIIGLSQDYALTMKEAAHILRGILDGQDNAQITAGLPQLKTPRKLREFVPSPTP